MRNTKRISIDKEQIFRAIPIKAALFFISRSDDVSLFFYYKMKNRKNRVCQSDHRFDGTGKKSNEQQNNIKLSAFRNIIKKSHCKKQ